MFSRIGRALHSMASAVAIAAMSMSQMNEIKGHLRLKLRELALQHAASSRFRRHSFTKRGPGRHPRWGDTRAAVSHDNDMSPGQRFHAGYMNRGEAMRYINAAPTRVERQNLYNARYRVRDGGTGVAA